MLAPQIVTFFLPVAKQPRRSAHILLRLASFPEGGSLPTFFVLARFDFIIAPPVVSEERLFMRCIQKIPICREIPAARSCGLPPPVGE